MIGPIRFAPGPWIRLTRRVGPPGAGEIQPCEAAELWSWRSDCWGCSARPIGPGRRRSAFNPTVSSLPDGVGLSVTPAVTADRRYVRLSINAGFQTIDGFRTSPCRARCPAAGTAAGSVASAGSAEAGVPAEAQAVAVAGAVGSRVVSGMNGPIGPGMAGGSGDPAASRGRSGYDYGYGGPGYRRFLRRGLERLERLPETEQG